MKRLAKRLKLGRLSAGFAAVGVGDPRVIKQMLQQASDRQKAQVLCREMAGGDDELGRWLFDDVDALAGQLRIPVLSVAENVLKGMIHTPATAHQVLGTIKTTGRLQPWEMGAVWTVGWDQILHQEDDQ